MSAASPACRRVDDLDRGSWRPVQPQPTSTDVGRPGVVVGSSARHDAAVPERGGVDGQRPRRLVRRRARDEQGRLREAVGRPERLPAEAAAARTADRTRRWWPARTGSEPLNATRHELQVERVAIGVGRRAGRRDRRRSSARRCASRRSVGDRLEPAGRPLQERDGRHQPGGEPAEHRLQHALDQAHVVVHRQPRDRDRAGVVEAEPRAVGEIVQQVGVRDHHAARRRRSTPTCTAGTRCRRRPARSADVRHASSLGSVLDGEPPQQIAAPARRHRSVGARGHGRCRASTSSTPASATMPRSRAATRSLRVPGRRVGRARQSPARGRRRTARRRSRGPEETAAARVLRRRRDRESPPRSPGSGRRAPATSGAPASCSPFSRNV